MPNLSATFNIVVELAFNPDYAAGNGQILLGQFSTADGTGISGAMLLRVVSNGVSSVHYVSFYHVPAPGALWLFGAMGLLDRRRRARERGER